MSVATKITFLLCALAVTLSGFLSGAFYTIGFQKTSTLFFINSLAATALLFKTKPLPPLQN